MRQRHKRAFLSWCLLAGLVCQAMHVRAQQAIGTAVSINGVHAQDGGQGYKDILRLGQGDELHALLEKLFGGEAGAAAAALGEDSEQLLLTVMEGAGAKAEESLEEQIRERRERPGAKPVIAPETEANPAPRAKPRIKPAAKPRRAAYGGPPRLDWRQVAFGFQPLNFQDQSPEIKMTETDKEIKAEGSDKKTFETEEAKGTRTQKAETRYIKDGKTFGVEITNTQIIDAVSKSDGKGFRKELSMAWGAEVAACPDANGITAGTGKAKVVSKTTYTEAGATVTMTSEFDLQAQLTGHVNDRAEMTHYDLVIDAYTENSGYEEALRRGLIKEIKIRDGRYGIRYDIPGNTVEVSDGKYGGKRTPARMGKATGRKLTTMSDADATLVGSAIGQMVPAIWNSANEMYTSAQRNWRNYGCVEVACKVPKLTLKPGEDVSIAAETVHRQDGSKVNAELTAEAYQGRITPETQRATPTATFTFTQEGEEPSTFNAESVSKRGIGRGEVEFRVEKEKEESAENGVWTGTINAERKQREEREKRSGSNLQENGGYLQTTTNVRLQLTGRLDRSVEANNAYLATVSGEQQQVDHEYDRYKIDEGYCGPNAVPYKGPKEITRTSTTTVNYNNETRVFVEIGRTGGSITFSLPEQNGSTVHKYVHKSPCSENDRANTNEATDADVAGVGGNFSFSFPVDPAQQTIKGSITVREEGGSTTVYRWDLTRR
jgi:hypothetical protein